METKKQTKEIKKSRGVNAFIVIVACLILAECFFFFVLGKPSNFEDGNTDNHPINLLGTMFKGGFVVPLILTLLFTVIVLSVERFFALNKAKGKGNLIKFVANVKKELANGNIDNAQKLCEKQQGSVAAIVDAGLTKYREVESLDISKEMKVEAIKNEIEEATEPANNSYHIYTWYSYGTFRNSIGYDSFVPGSCRCRWCRLYGSFGRYL